MIMAQDSIESHLGSVALILRWLVNWISELVGTLGQVGASSRACGINTLMYWVLDDVQPFMISALPDGSAASKDGDVEGRQSVGSSTRYL